MENTNQHLIMSNGREKSKRHGNIRSHKENHDSFSINREQTRAPILRKTWLSACFTLSSSVKLVEISYRS